MSFISSIDCLPETQAEYTDFSAFPARLLVWRYWCVPLPRNPFFTGREEILATLHTHLGAERAVALTQSYALHGLGGIGKTQLALEYAYRHALEYRAVLWIEAETRERITASLLRLAEILALPDWQCANQQQVLAAAQRWLATHSHWLLIWDIWTTRLCCTTSCPPRTRARF